MENNIKIAEWWLEKNLKNNRERCIVNASDVVCTIVRETDKAMLLNYTSKLFHQQLEFWVPKSVLNTDVNIEFDKNKISEGFFIKEFFSAYEHNVWCKNDYKCYILKETDKALYIKFEKRSKENFIATCKDKDATFYFTKWVNRSYIVNQIEINNIKYKQLKKDDNNIYYISELLNEETLNHIADADHIKQDRIKFADEEGASYENSYIRRILCTSFKDKYLKDIELEDEPRLGTFEEVSKLDITEYYDDENKFIDFWINKNNEIGTLKKSKNATDFSAIRVLLTLKRND